MYDSRSDAPHGGAHPWRDHAREEAHIGYNTLAPTTRSVRQAPVEVEIPAGVRVRKISRWHLAHA